MKVNKIRVYDVKDVMNLVDQEKNNEDAINITDLYVNSSVIANWKCKNGHTWSAVIKDRTKQNGNRCLICRQYE